MARGRKPKNVEKPAEATQAEAEEMIQSGEAEIPAEAIVSEKPAAKSRSSDQDLDYASHPKFHKFKGKAKGAE